MFEPNTSRQYLSQYLEDKPLESDLSNGSIFLSPEASSDFWSSLGKRAYGKVNLKTTHGWFAGC